MHHDYQPYVYKLANLDNKYHKILNMDNLFAKMFILGVIWLIFAVIFEITVDVTTNFGFFLVNLVRVLEYEPKINFLSHGFSVLILGNFITIILLITYNIGTSIHAMIKEVKHYVHCAQKEISENERYEREHKEKDYK